MSTTTNQPASPEHAELAAIAAERAAELIRKQAAGEMVPNAFYGVWADEPEMIPVTAEMIRVALRDAAMFASL
jgi:hypothetical protein